MESNTKRMIFKNLQYIVNYNDKIHIEDTISFQLITFSVDETNNLTFLSFKLISSDNIKLIKNFIFKCEEIYDQGK